ncbi:hypothetical protein F5883DRAFT_185377 [Diaporthe sp. PMI_573]|nr:hypothetical protein F5883DRAFT_185377 [Diaporthaceae sp. PMI_573]
MSTNMELSIGNLISHRANRPSRDSKTHTSPQDREAALFDPWWETRDAGNFVENSFHKDAVKQNEVWSTKGRVLILSLGSASMFYMRDLEAQTERVVTYSQVEEEEESTRPPNMGPVDGLMFTDPDELLRYGWKHGLRFFKRQLLVLEDLGRDWVEAIGVAFRIPVYFFALHWADPVDHAWGIARMPLGHRTREHNILRYRETLPIIVNADSSKFPLSRQRSLSLLTCSTCGTNRLETQPSVQCTATPYQQSPATQ